MKTTKTTGTKKYGDRTFGQKRLTIGSVPMVF